MWTHCPFARFVRHGFIFFARETMWTRFSGWETDFIFLGKESNHRFGLTSSLCTSLGLFLIVFVARSFLWIFLMTSSACKFAALLHQPLNIVYGWWCASVSLPPFGIRHESIIWAERKCIRRMPSSSHQRTEKLWVCMWDKNVTFYIKINQSHGIYAKYTIIFLQITEISVNKCRQKAKWSHCLLARFKNCIFSFIFSLWPSVT